MQSFLETIGLWRWNVALLNYVGPLILTVLLFLGPLMQEYLSEWKYLSFGEFVRQFLDWPSRLSLIEFRNVVFVSRLCTVVVVC
jgi:hypothetical protein